MTLNERKRREMRVLSCKRMMLLFAPIILLSCDQIKPASAILNCFTPNMFKMGKQNPAAGYGFERGAMWPYNQQAGYPTSGFGSSGYGYNPMKMLFQPKWRTGGLLGGGKWNNWKMGANSNFYRPNYGYGQQIPSASGYSLGEQQLNVAPLPPPSPFNSYSPSNDGWSVPISYNHIGPALQQVQQSQLTGYDNYSPSLTTLPAKLQTVTPSSDPYGGTSTKGGGTTTTKSKFPIPTKNNILLADGGYDAYDAHLVDGIYRSKNQSYGYSYPDWYSGVESPARIAQNLLYKSGGYKRLRQQELNRSAPLIQVPASLSPLRLQPSSNQFTILDEPRFVGYGTVDISSNKEARLSCSFGEAIDQTNRPLWTKFQGPYDITHTSNGKVVPPFNCNNSLCRTQEIESTKDYRYRFDTGPATSTLIISEPRLADYGVYRCSALTKAMNNNPLETIYQIVQFGTLL